MAKGWRGAPSPAVSAGAYGAQLTGPGSNTDTGNPVVTNVTGLPVASYPTGDTYRIPATNVVPARQAPMPGLGKGIPGRPIHDASGNPGVATVDPRSDARYGKLEAPPWGAGESGPHGIGLQAPDERQHYPNVLHEVGWRGGFQIANDKLWATDRHAYLEAGTERGGGRGSGVTDPPMDGPARPSLKLVQRTINWQQGTDTTINQDHYPEEGMSRYEMVDQVPPHNTIGDFPGVPSTQVNGLRYNEPGRQFLGEQGTGWSPVYGGVPGLWQPYGSYAGYTADPIQGIQSPAPQGSPGDGPQKVWSGLPHGLHSITYPDYATTLGRYLAIPQQALPRIDRPSNATGAGQSFSQTVQPQGQTGTVAQQVGGRGSGVNWRAVSSGWRGIRPGGAQT